MNPTHDVEPLIMYCGSIAQFKVDCEMSDVSVVTGDEPRPYMGTVGGLDVVETVCGYLLIGSPLAIREFLGGLRSPGSLLVIKPGNRLAIQGAHDATANAEDQKRTRSATKDCADEG